ncbi:TetR/AcrR family transcriptional regulator [Nocardia asteroides]|uniref:TetR/AcrR family transcriptional regulator n=1 Tax=Nocardia asteroides TaxID=1824 RepID=UPI00379F2967
MSKSPEPELRPRELSRANTRTKLLDAAEELFADRGYFGVGVREITDLANTRVAAVSDQFGGKEGLFQAVLLRRIEPLNTDRRARLASLPTSGDRRARLRALIDAFAGPMLDRAGDVRWRYYFRFVAQLANSAQSIQLLVVEQFNGIAADFVTELQRLFPAASEAAINDAYLHLVAATLHTYSDNLRLDVLTNGRLHTSDLGPRHRALLDFAEGGIIGLVDNPHSA